ACELFLRPGARFVGAFRGRTHLGAGVAEAADPLVHGPLRLRVGGGLAPGARAAVSIRPQDIGLAPAGGAGASAGHNALAGTIKRASFLGESVDYQVELPGGLTLRVAAPAGRRLLAGAAVELTIDPAVCVPVGEEPR